MEPAYASLKSKLNSVPATDTRPSGYSIFLDVLLEDKNLTTVEIPLNRREYKAVNNADYDDVLQKRNAEKIIEEYFDTNLKLSYYLGMKIS